jgi:hypothetical protein
MTMTLNFENIERPFVEEREAPPKQGRVYVLDGTRPNGEEPPDPPRDLIEDFTLLGDAPHAPPKELIKKLLPASGVVIQGGQSSAGKTFLEIYKAVCLASSRPF